MYSGTPLEAVLSLIAAGSWGAGDFAGGLASKRVNVFRVVAVSHSTGLILMLLLAIATGEAVPANNELIWGAAAGLVGAVGIVSLYQALAIGRMGVVAPVASVVTAVLPVVISFTSEGLPSHRQVAGFGLALVSIWLIAKPQKVHSRNGTGLAVLAGVGFGFFLVASKQAGPHAVFWPLVAARATSTILMLLILLVSARDTRSLRQVLPTAILSGVCDSTGNALFIAATRYGRLDVASVLSSLYPASTVLLARVVLKERIAMLQAAGVVGALLSVALISRQ